MNELASQIAESITVLAPAVAASTLTRSAAPVAFATKRSGALTKTAASKPKPTEGDKLSVRDGGDDMTALLGGNDLTVFNNTMLPYAIHGDDSTVYKLLDGKDKELTAEGAIWPPKVVIKLEDAKDTKVKLIDDKIIPGYSPTNSDAYRLHIVGPALDYDGFDARLAVNVFTGLKAVDLTAGMVTQMATLSTDGKMNSGLYTAVDNFAKKTKTARALINKTVEGIEVASDLCEVVSAVAAELDLKSNYSVYKNYGEELDERFCGRLETANKYGMAVKAVLKIETDRIRKDTYYKKSFGTVLFLVIGKDIEDFGKETFENEDGSFSKFKAIKLLVKTLKAPVALMKDVDKAALMEKFKTAMSQAELKSMDEDATVVDRFMNYAGYYIGGLDKGFWPSAGRLVAIGGSIISEKEFQQAALELVVDKGAKAVMAGNFAVVKTSSSAFLGTAIKKASLKASLKSIALGEHIGNKIIPFVWDVVSAPADMSITIVNGKITNVPAIATNLTVLKNGVGVASVDGANKSYRVPVLNVKPGDVISLDYGVDQKDVWKGQEGSPLAYALDSKLTGKPVTRAVGFDLEVSGFGDNFSGLGVHRAYCTRVTTLLDAFEKQVMFLESADHYVSCLSADGKDFDRTYAKWEKNAAYFFDNVTSGNYIHFKHDVTVKTGMQRIVLQGGGYSGTSSEMVVLTLEQLNNKPQVDWNWIQVDPVPGSPIQAQGSLVHFTAVEKATSKDTDYAKQLKRSYIFDPDGDQHTMSIDYGDDSGGPVGAGSLDEYHDYTKPGKYTVKLTVNDDGGGETVVSKEITVLAPDAPRMTIQVSNASPSIGETVTFWIDSVLDGAATVYWYIADMVEEFFDGLKGIAESISHVFQTAGEKTIIVGLSDGVDVGSVKDDGQTQIKITVKCPTGQIEQGGKCVDSTTEPQPYVSWNFNNGSVQDDQKLFFSTVKDNVALENGVANFNGGYISVDAPLFMNNECNATIVSRVKYKYSTARQALIATADLRPFMDPVVMMITAGKLEDVQFADTSNGHSIFVDYNQELNNVPSDTWSVVALRLEQLTPNSSKMTVLINGVVVGEKTTDYKHCVSYDQDMPLTIGAAAEPGITRWQGAIDYVKVYKQTLSDAQIKKMADSVTSGYTGAFTVPATSETGVAFTSPSSTKPLQCSFTATGLTAEAARSPYIGPDGRVYDAPNFPMPGKPLMALIAKHADASYELIGSRASIGVKRGETLLFLTNDNHWGDNRGQLDVTYTCSEIPQPAWTTNPANGHQYAAVDCGTWTQCEAQAVALGGHLVSVNDSAENAWLVSTFTPEKNYWIGLTDKDQEGVWKWTSGEVFGYGNWHTGEPNNAGGVESYVHMNLHYNYYDRHITDGTWNDAVNDITPAFVNSIPYGTSAWGIFEKSSSENYSVEWHYPNIGTLITGRQNNEVKVTVTANDDVEVVGFMNTPKFDVDIIGKRVKLFNFRSYSAYPNMTQFTSGTFNGLVLRAVNGAFGSATFALDINGDGDFVDEGDTAPTSSKITIGSDYIAANLSGVNLSPSAVMYIDFQPL